MVSTFDFLPLPYTHDLTEAGIAYALHTLPHMHPSAGGLTYERLRKMVGATAVELAFRRYLSRQGIPFKVKGAAPFTEPDRYDVLLGGQRCELQCSLISQPDDIQCIQHNPAQLLKRPVLVGSDLHAGAGHSLQDLYIFAFLFIPSPAFQAEQKKPNYLVHVMPALWNHPRQWSPLGELVLKSEADETHHIEIGGQNEAGGMESFWVDLPPRQRVEIQTKLFSLAYVHTKSHPDARIGIHSLARRQTHLVGAREWDDICVQGMDIVLAGYLSHAEFGQRASYVQAGAHILPFHHTHVKSLAVPVSELRPLGRLLERAKPIRT